MLQLREEGDNLVAHNTYLGTSAELGLVGLALYLGVLVLDAPDARSRRASRDASSARRSHGA